MPIESATQIAVVAFSKIQSDGRVLRQIEWLRQTYQIKVIGYGELPFRKNVEMFSLPESLLPANLTVLEKILRRILTGQLLPYGQLIAGRIFPRRAYEAWYWQRPECQQAYEKLLELRPNFIHANDWLTLPLAVRASKKIGARVLADLHEYAPLELDGFIWHAFLRPLREYVLNRYMPHTTASITVNQTIAEKYQRVFGFSPIVVLNTPVQNAGIIFRKTDPESINLIHHGVLAQARNPEIMLHTATFLDPRFHLNLMLVGETNRIRAFQAVAEKIAPGRVTFHDAVTPDQVVETISRYDIGFFILPTNIYNYAAALPNKFFEFIQAGLAICIGPSPEMARLCSLYGVGKVSPSFNPREVAAVINALTCEEIDRMKQASIEARRELNADIELSKLVTLYDRLNRETA